MMKKGSFKNFLDVKKYWLAMLSLIPIWYFVGILIWALAEDWKLNFTRWEFVGYNIQILFFIVMGVLLSMIAFIGNRILIRDY